MTHVLGYLLPHDEEATEQHELILCGANLPGLSYLGRDRSKPSFDESWVGTCAESLKK